jgi:hypothetical protein
MVGSKEKVIVQGGGAPIRIQRLTDQNPLKKSGRRYI